MLVCMYNSICMYVSRYVRAYVCMYVCTLYVCVCIYECKNVRMTPTTTRSVLVVTLNLQPHLIMKSMLPRPSFIIRLSKMVPAINSRIFHISFSPPCLLRHHDKPLYEGPLREGLGQGFETACPKLAIVNFLVSISFKCSQRTTINMYLPIQKRLNVIILCHRSYI